MHKTVSEGVALIKCIGPGALVLCGHHSVAGTEEDTKAQKD